MTLGSAVQGLVSWMCDSRVSSAGVSEQGLVRWMCDSRVSSAGVSEMDV